MILACLFVEGQYLVILACHSSWQRQYLGVTICSQKSVLLNRESTLQIFACFLLSLCSAENISTIHVLLSCSLLPASRSHVALFAQNAARLQARNHEKKQQKSQKHIGKKTLAKMRNIEKT